MPIPSSYIAAAAVSRFDGIAGLAIVFLGSFCASILAYYLGSFTEVDIARTPVRDGGQYDMRFPSGRAVLLSVFLSRGIPIAAETSSIVSGAYRIPITSFLFVSGISCLIVAVVYRVFFDFGRDYINESSVLIVGTLIPAVFWLLTIFVKSVLKRHKGSKL
jgi:uncharacterized membrane protein YdjX (TVP38/TMEM64 family)